MGILDGDIPQQNIDFSLIASNRVVEHSVSTFNMLLFRYEEGTKIFWKNPRGITPAAIAEKLGTNAAEIFRLHYALGQFLETIKPGCTENINSLIPWDTFTLNQDGTVTIQPESTPN